MCLCHSVPVQDHVLPFCMDLRFPRDTLFLVFEEDFRFWPDEKEPLRAAVKYGERAEEYGYPADAARGASPPQPYGQLALADAASSSASPPQQTDRRESMPPASRRQISKFQFTHGIKARHAAPAQPLVQRPATRSQHACDICCAPMQARLQLFAWPSSLATWQSCAAARGSCSGRARPPR